MEKQALEEQVKREQDIARQKEDLEELRRQYRSRLFDEEDLQNLKESAEFKRPETRKKFREQFGRKSFNAIASQGHVEST